ncbi:MAG: hypothetical protein ACC682_00405 [Gemmatimonadota bacterium]
MTVEPIAPGTSRRRKAGQLERLTADIEALEIRVAEVRVSEERRAPLVRAREECVVVLTRLGEETERLETAFETLSEGRRRDTEIEAVRARVRGLERAEHELDEALAGFNLIVAREGALAALYPPDFAERARALEEGLWPRRADVREESARLLEESGRDEPAMPPRAQFGVAAAAVLAGGALAVTGTTLIGFVGLVVGLVGGALLYTRRRGAQVRATFRANRLGDLAGEGFDLDGRIARLTADVPDGSTLEPETLSAARREFEREEADRRLRDESERALRQAMDAATRAIRFHEDGKDEPAGESESHGEEKGLTDRGRVRLRALQEAIATERDDHMAPLRLRLNEIARAVRSARRRRSGPREGQDRAPCPPRPGEGNPGETHRSRARPGGGWPRDRECSVA